MSSSAYPRPGVIDKIGSPDQKWLEGHYVDLTTESVGVEFNDTSEVWIGQRGIGSGGTRVAGTGNKTDPFDGTTQASFDALMTTHKAVPNRIIRLDDGGYSSNFAWGSSVAAGVKIITSSGNPRDTVITNTTKVGRLISLIGDNCHVEGFTIDCVGLGVTTTTGVATRSNNGIIRKVRVTRPCDGSAECFAIASFCSATSTTGNLIEYCEVDNFIGASASLIFLGGDGVNAAATNTGIVQNNRVRDGNGSAYGSGGTLNAIFRNNESLNCKRGFNRDTGLVSGHQMLNNRFMGCSEAGIVLWGAATPAYNDRVIGNVVEMIPNDTSKLAYYLHNDLRGIVIADNEARFKAGDQPWCWGFYVHYIASGLIAYGNRSAIEFRNEFSMVDGSQPSLLYDNTNLDGSPMYLNPITASSRQPIPFNIQVHSLARRLDILPSSLLDPDVAEMRSVLPPEAVISDAAVGYLDTLAKGFKTDATWDLFYEIYPFIGDFEAMLLKLKYANDPFLDNNGFVSGQYVEAGATGGLKGLGIGSVHLDTLWNPVEEAASLTDFSIGVYVAGAVTAGVSSTEIGNTAAGGELTRLGWGNIGSREVGEIGSAVQANAGASALAGSHIVTCNGDRVQRYYHNGVQVTTGAGDNPGVFADSSLFLGAMRTAGGSAIDQMIRYLRFGFIGLGLDATEALNIHNRIQTYQTSLTRNV